jgi:hypothetical protein
MRRIKNINNEQITSIATVDRFTKLYLPMTGSNNSTTIVDKSFNPHTITCQGNAKLSTSIFKNNGSSCSFDGSTAYLTYDSTAIALGIQNSVIVIEFWAYFNTDTTVMFVNIGGSSTTYTAGSFCLYYIPTVGWTFARHQGGGQTANYARPNTAWHPQTNAWAHYAFVWNADGTSNYYVNGIATNLNVSTASASIGFGNAPYFSLAGYYDSTVFDGYISDLRILDGTDRGWTTPTIQLDNPNMSVTTGKDIVEFTKLWIPGYGVNGATDIKDKSVYGKAVTNTDVIVSTTQSKFNGSSLYFNGSSSFLTAASNSIYTMASSNFVIGGWVNPSRFSSGAYDRQKFIGTSTAAANDFIDLAIMNSSHKVRVNVTVGGANFYMDSSGTLTQDVWSYVIFVRNGTTWTLYIDGVDNGNTTSSVTLPYMDLPITIGRGAYADGQYFQGYMSDMVWVVGTNLGYAGATVAVPSKPFSLRGVPQRSYTALPYDGVADGIDKYTKLYLPLTEPGNAFTDRSFVPATVTAGNVASSTTYSKFGGSAAYWNGSNATLRIPSSLAVNPASSDKFAISMWVNFTSRPGGTDANSYPPLIGQHTDSTVHPRWALFSYNWNNAGQLYFNNTNSAGNAVFDVASDTLAWSLNTWYHIACSKSGNTINIYRNGIRVATGNKSAYSSDISGNDLTLGSYYYNGSATVLFNGYMQAAKVDIGTDRGWTGDTITVPTRPAQIPLQISKRDLQTSINTPANPVLYIKGDSYTDNSTNIFDSSPYARTITNTGVVTRTINQKYGPSSLYFDSDNLAISNLPIFGTNLFTIEGWLYPTDNTSRSPFGAYTDASNVLDIWIDSSSYLYIYCKALNSDFFYCNTSEAIPVNTWTHLAIVRYGTSLNNLKVFYNGVEKTLTWSTNLAVNASIPAFSTFYIGRSGRQGDPDYQGYIDELTCWSIARYTSNFNIPQGPYKF